MPQKLTVSTTRDQMILDGMAQVKLIAKPIHAKVPGNVNLDDLVSAGTLGLIMAIDRYDVTQGVKLKTYAEYKIRGAIIDSLRSADWAPRLQRKRARLISAASATLEQRLQRTPKEEELAVELGISRDEYRDWARDANGLAVRSLDSVTSQDDGRDLLQFVAEDTGLLPSQLVEQSELSSLVAKAIQRMPAIERTVLNMYYHQELTLRDIAGTLKLHESRISQLKTQAVSRLRTFLASRWPERGQLLAAA